MHLSETYEIYAIIDNIRKNPFNEKFNNCEILHKIDEIVKNNLEFKLILPALHGKSSNRDFVFSHLPDYGEYLAIQTLVKLHDDLAKVYPTVKIILTHEGHLHADCGLCGTDDELCEYESALQEMLSPYPFIHSYSTDTFFPGMSYEAQRKYFTEHYCPTEEEISALIANDKKYSNLYKQYIALYSLRHNDESKEKYPTKNAVTKYYSKPRARAQIARYIGFGRLIKEFFTDDSYVKLSQLYKDPSIKDQIGINMIGGCHDLGTSLFNVILRDRKNNFSYVKLDKALSSGHTPIQANGLLLCEERKSC